MLNTEQGEANHTWPFIIPDREAVLFVIGTGPPLTSGQLAVLELDTGEVTPLGLAGVSPRYVSTGHLVYAVEDGSVRAVSFDVASLEVTGNPVPMVEGVNVKVSGAANFSISDNGRLVYALGTGGRQESFVWVDREGREEPVAVDSRDYSEFALSPDGLRVAARVVADTDDVWVFDLVRNTAMRLTFEETEARFPTWTPDGTRIAFGSPLSWKRADGTGEAEVLTADPRGDPQAFSPDGSILLFVDRSSGNDIGMLSLEGDRASTLLLQGEYDERNASLSPDGRHRWSRQHTRPPELGKRR